MKEWIVRQVLNNEAAKSLLATEIDLHSKHVIDVLRTLNPVATFRRWHNIYRSIEEFINIVIVDPHTNDGITKWLQETRVDQKMMSGMSMQLLEIKMHLEVTYDAAVVGRFISLLRMAANYRFSSEYYSDQVDHQGFDLSNVLGLAHYFQARRRHYLILLYAIGAECRGDRSLEAYDLFYELVALVDTNIISITGLKQKLLIANIIDSYSLIIDGNRCCGSVDYSDLEGFFLEAETVGIMDVHEHLRQDDTRLNSDDDKEDLPEGEMFSVEEMRNELRQIEVAFSKFDLSNTFYGKMREFIFNLSALFENRYSLAVGHDAFSRMIEIEFGLYSDVIKKELICKDKDYADCGSIFSPFIFNDGMVFSNVRLITRFMYFYRGQCLRRNKKYQINSGFVFERMVSKSLEAQGFYITDVKRIDKKEFDVVALREGKIYNFQCKNNYIDMRLASGEANIFIRYNKRLIKYYERSLKKELAREELLKGRLGLSEVRHYVISRFPVVTDNDYILPFNRIESL